MTTILLSLEPVPVEVTFDQSGLNVGMTVLRWNGSAWVQVSRTPVPNTGSGSNTYASIFTPATYDPYVVEMAVFTDNTLATYQDGYLAASKAFRVDTSIVTLLSLVSSLGIGIVGKVASRVVSGIVPGVNVKGSIGPNGIGGKVPSQEINQLVSTRTIRGSVDG